MAKPTIGQRLSAYFAKKAADYGFLPWPSRHQSWGRFPLWSDMIGVWGYKPKPIEPSEANFGTDNAVVNICINWIATSWQVAQMQVGTRDDASEESFVPLENHPLLDLLRAPNENTDGASLFWASVADFACYGNVYWYKLRGGLGGVVGLQWIPARFVAPVPDADSGQLSHYVYQPSGASERIEIDPRDLVHIKHGIDPIFPLRGIAPLAAQYREIVTDNAYSDYAGGLAKNGALPTAIMTPRAVSDGLGGTVAMNREDAEYVSEKLYEKLQTQTGRIPVLPSSVDLHTLSLDPNKMAMTEVRAMPETRIPAALGLPALLLQLYTGVQRSTFANLDTAIKQGWRGCIIPYQRVFASAINRQLLPEFQAAGRRRGGAVSPAVEFRFDYSAVPELKEDELAQREADRNDVAAGILTVQEARERQGLAPLPENELAEPVHNEPTPAEAMADAQEKAVRAALGLRLKRDTFTAPEGGDIYEVADAFRRALAANEAAALADMASAWERARKAIEAELSDVLEAIAGLDGLDDGEKAARLHDLAGALERKMADVDAHLADLADRGAAITETAQRAAIDTTTNATPALARAMAGPAPAGASLPWNRLSADTFEALVGLSSSGSPLSDLLAAFGQETGQGIRQALLDGIALGENPRQVAARLSAQYSVARARAETIARTEMLRASREATRRTYRANADVLDGYIRLSAADSRTCVSCWALHGKQSESTAFVPSHCNCRCCIVPAVKSWAELLGDPSLPDTRAQIPDGEELFAALGEDMQREILGPGRLALYQQGTRLSDMTETTESEWGPTVAVKPLSEVAR